MAIMLDDMGIVDVTSADQPEEFGEDDPVLADGQRERISPAWILTAAHCVYDDVNKAFARNVLFIPDQAGTTGAGTDQDCSNDPVGCWEPSHGVVDVDWLVEEAAPRWEVHVDREKAIRSGITPPYSERILAPMLWPTTRAGSSGL